MDRKLDRKDSMQKHVSDMLAVERHVLEAVGRQRDAEEVHKNTEANELIIRMERMLQGHVETLESLADEYGAEGESTLKKALTSVFGAAAGLYDRVRIHEISRMLRDNYTALSLCAMAYTAMHTYGLAIKENRIATVALKHLKDITPVMVEISRVLPHVVAAEVAEVIEDSVDPNAARKAVENTQEAWSHKVTEMA